MVGMIKNKFKIIKTAGLKSGGFYIGIFRIIGVIRIPGIRGI